MKTELNGTAILSIPFWAISKKERNGTTFGSVPFSAVSKTERNGPKRNQRLKVFRFLRFQKRNGTERNGTTIQNVPYSLEFQKGTEQNGTELNSNSTCSVFFWILNGTERNVTERNGTASRSVPFFCFFKTERSGTEQNGTAFGEGPFSEVFKTEWNRSFLMFRLTEHFAELNGTVIFVVPFWFAVKRNGTAVTVPPNYSALLPFKFGSFKDCVKYDNVAQCNPSEQSGTARNSQKSIKGTERNSEDGCSGPSRSEMTRNIRKRNGTELNGTGFWSVPFCAILETEQNGTEQLLEVFRFQRFPKRNVTEQNGTEQ